MNSKTIRHLLLTFVLICFSSDPQCSFAEIKLAAPFGDNMVLQRGMENPVWGWAEPNSKISISARDQNVSTVADSGGKWNLILKPMKLGEPFSIVIKSATDNVELKNVVVGEVWICSGQSNMEWTVNRSGNPEQERNNANYPMIRHLNITNSISTSPRMKAGTSGWQVCSPETAGDFTAVGYYFGRKLHQELNVPIGLINSTWGGTIVEAWTSADSLSTHPDFSDRIKKIQNNEADRKQTMEQFERDIKDWQEKYDNALAESDKQSSGDIDDSNWNDINAPGPWETQGYRNYDGIAWYRKKIELPQAMVGKDLTLSLAMIDDNDRTFVNGQFIGTTKGWQSKRKYEIPASVNTNSDLTISVQVHDTAGSGGIHGNANQMMISADGIDPLPIAGKWRFKKSEPMQKLPPRPAMPGFRGPNNPTALYNAMIHPLIPVAFKGAIWYQGESNASRAFQYRSLFPLLITDWRTKWNRDLPFYWVQLANFRRVTNEPVESDWAELREAQSMTLSLPNTGEAVIIDIGEARDIHPKNKQDVGKRLALHALKNEYGIKVIHSGPRFQQAVVEGDQIRLQFEYADGLKSVDGKPLARFQIAGADKTFVWGDAKIEGDEVVVSSNQIQQPVAVRYAWADNPAGCNLTNSSNLPASPFRTDDWPGVTVGN